MTTFLALGFLALLAATPATVRYEVRTPADDPYSPVLVALDGRKVVTLVDPAKPTPPFSEGTAIMNVVRVADFDADGTLDALVLFSGGGNCCPSSYRFVTYRPGKAPLFSNAFDSWRDPKIETYQGRLVAVYRDEDAARWKSWAYRGGKAVLVRAAVIPELKALLNIRREAFDERRNVFAFDLNEDGSNERIECGIWDRWDTLQCGVTDAKGRELLSPSVGCDRYGVLATKTRGYHDLVCGLDWRIRWNGKEYVAPDFE
ncbi:hypothetical protein [Deinococcus yavapaiensis]|uniref:VCBS repeat protein n=1 Tax=Deinococcus yavapaiensis KR-236 TaxID=694435 RepID=A0A318SGI8_9DEIO|nr:hypothetical protein [Deinococcus yavapaiensis]PYE56514.1 hypothetical protein DES52_101318 [Deinococcus yavapaiensis KR-236]